jgi:hypothetical protein
MGDRAIRTGRLKAALGAALLAALAILPAPAHAWGDYAHRQTARIAEANVTSQTRAEIRRLLRAEKLLGTPKCPLRNFADASVWADCIRAEGWRWSFTAPWHYRTTPICEAYDPRANCANGNCVTAQIERSHRILSDKSLPDHIRLEALAFLVHFTGDIHMPLHSGDREDRGGNDRVADYGIIPELNLHWIWDGPLAERAISDPADPVVRRYSSAERGELGGGTAADWGRESWRIAREVVYPNAFHTEDVCTGDLPRRTALSQDDIVAAGPVARRRVQQAGIRIAELLDSALGPQAPE